MTGYELIPRDKFLVHKDGKETLILREHVLTKTKAKTKKENQKRHTNKRKVATVKRVI